ncbi:cellulase family glycosylhydrolase [Streptomyces sp. MBT58]|uniref:fibronectin type III domain-containing protein n=1 Tax=Streptomyces sp. MBT58 TaxID=1488389 RepID=UPI0019140D6F|nr:cellulase family glycosylhydrolase [Streptomyces sp. MBT58]MBK5992512.1 cellulase family glycosylhydrolase [Streptomyces sp. MBT58]
MLTLQGEPFRFAGTNLYWLGLDENVRGTDHPTYFRIDDALKTARIMNASVVRSHTLGTSLGCAPCIQPGPGEFNNDAFAPIDYAIARARAYGLRLIVPLTDQWGYYHGGYPTMAKWLGLKDPEDFYTDPRAKAAYKEYSRQVLNHRNPYTGLRYKDDPTVMSWELGNELNGMTRDWVDEMGAYLGKLAPRQLISVGRQQGVDTAALTSPEVDIVDVHYYPSSVLTMAADAACVTGRGKVYLAGEHGSDSLTAADALALADDPNVTGVLSWSLFGHADDHGYVRHDDGCTLHYPGDTAAMRTDVLANAALAKMIGGQRRLPALPVTPPLITSVTKQSGINEIAWRGTVGAHTYRIQRSVRGAHGPWTTLTTTPVGDNDTPWLDPTTPHTQASYRVSALDRAGCTLVTSAPLGAGPSEDAEVDTLQNWARMSAHSDSLQRAPDGDGDGVRIAPRPRATAHAAWKVERPEAFTARFATRADSALPTPEVTQDGTTWKQVKPVRSTTGGTTTLRIEPPHDTAGVRLVWAAASHPAPLTCLTLVRKAASVATAAPGAFRQNPGDGATGVPVGEPLAWTAPENAAHYAVVLSTNADLSDPVIDVAGPRTTSYRPPVNLRPNTTYHLRVTAVNGAGSRRAENAPLSFTTSALTVDDFEGYPDGAALSAAYPRDPGGGPVALSLDSQHADGKATPCAPLTTPGPRLLGNRPHPAHHTGLGRRAQPASLGTAGRHRGPKSDRPVRRRRPLLGEGGIPHRHRQRDRQRALADFTNSPWVTKRLLDLTHITQLSLYFNGQAGTTWIDSITATD